MLKVKWKCLLLDREFSLIFSNIAFLIYPLSLSLPLCTFPLPFSHLVHPQNCRRPILACWYVTIPGSIVYHPVDPDPTHQPTPAPSLNFTCRLMTGTSLWEPMTFLTAGQYVFIAVFYNSASKANSTIPFGVVQGEWFLMCTLLMHTQITNWAACWIHSHVHVGTVLFACEPLSPSGHLTVTHP